MSTKRLEGKNKLGLWIIEDVAHEVPIPHYILDHLFSLFNIYYAVFKMYSKDMWSNRMNNCDHHQLKKQNVTCTAKLPCAYVHLDVSFCHNQF